MRGLCRRVKPLITIVLVVFLSMISITGVQAGGLKVVASIFPLYDFARVVAGSDADVRILLPAGVEPHSWEPRPSDIIAVSRADVFLYVSGAMEPWAHNLVSAVGKRDISFVEVMNSLEFSGTGEGSSYTEIPAGEVGHNTDPHFWLDLSQSASAARIIGGLFAKKDPAHADGYIERAEAYALRLEELDGTFTKGLQTCRTRKFVTGGHSAFGHLAKRYKLHQISLYGVSPDSEPTPAHLASVSTVMRRENLDVVFFEEMVNPRLARVLASETGASTRILTPAGNLPAEKMNQGVSFVQVMIENLQSLRKGLDCE